MVTQADIPPDLTEDDKAVVFQYLGAQLNPMILCALLHGIYTGILAVTLWNIFINRCWPIRRALVVVIIFLHALTTISFAAKWSWIHIAFIENGQSCWTVFLDLQFHIQAAYWETGIAGTISTILTDLYMIWCCWIVWGRRWFVVLLPILCLVCAIVSRIMDVYYDYNAITDAWVMPYISFILATTLWCTLLIIYRIVTVTGIRCGVEGRLKVYHRFIEVLVESSSLYTISLILDLTFTIHDSDGLASYYLDTIASISKGIAPTLIVGRITAGHRAHPDGSWQGSVIGSASIMSQERSQMSSWEDRPTSPVLDGDLEAQREMSVREPSPTLRSASVVADYAHRNTDVSPETPPHLRNRSLLHNCPSLYEDVTHDSTIVDEATALSR